MARRRSIYTIYRGDEFIDVGTLNELSQRNNVSIATLQFKATPTYVKRTKYKNTIRVYKVNEEETEWKSKED